MQDIANENESVCEEPAPRVRIRGFGDNSINLELLGWIKQPAERGAIVHALAREVITRFRRENIQIPFPQRDLHFKDGSGEAGPRKQATPGEAVQGSGPGEPNGSSSDG